MYQKIKTLAESAIALQNKGAMDAALREIGMIAEGEAMKTCFEDARMGRFGAVACGECGKMRSCAEGESPAEPQADAKPSNKKGSK